MNKVFLIKSEYVDYFKSEIQRIYDTMADEYELEVHYDVVSYEQHSLGTSTLIYTALIIAKKLK